MSISAKLIIPITAVLLFRGMAVAQIPVELFAGHKKVTLDILFFRYFKNNRGGHSRFLFFNRNRAGIEYKMTSAGNMPQFGFTEAVSYHPEKWKGFAPVLVGQLFNSGFYVKAGMQYARIKKDITLFSWLVMETRKNPGIDLFFLGRYTPGITEKLNLFSQLEIINTLPTSGQKNYSFTQRIRLGIQYKSFQWGAAADFSASGKSHLNTSNNIGGFLRYEY